jgi:hypothetical protein
MERSQGRKKSPEDPIRLQKGNYFNYFLQPYRFGYQTFDNSEIVKDIIKSNKYHGKSWESIQYQSRIEKTEAYLKAIRLKKTKASTVE